MTTPTTSTTTSPLPEIGYPRMMKLVSEPIYPQSVTKTAGCPHCQKPVSIPVPVAAVDPITWIVGGSHPLIPALKVIAMYQVDDGVDVYSVSEDGKSGLRNFVPSKTMRLTEDTMPLHVFVDELAAAENGMGDDDDDDEPEDELEQPTVPPAPNGQGAS